MRFRFRATNLVTFKWTQFVGTSYLPLISLIQFKGHYNCVSALDRHNLCTRLILETRCNTTAADLSEELFRLARNDISSDCRSDLLRQCNNSEVYFPNPYLLCISLISIALIFIIFEKLFEI